MVDPVVKTGVLAAIEPQVNALLALDPVTLKKLSQWFGKVVAFQCTSPRWVCFVHFEQDRVRLASTFGGEHEHEEEEVDATFAGSSAAFAVLATRRSLPFAEIPGLTISGDEVLINDLQHIHQQLDIDWERPLCQTFGDIPGHMMAQGLRSIGYHALRGQKLVMDNLGEYLQEELRLIPSRAEVEGFVAEVGELAKAMDRLENQWQKTLKSNTASDAKS